MILAMCVTFLPSAFISPMAVACSSDTFHLQPGLLPPHFFPFLRAASCPARTRRAIRTISLPWTFPWHSRHRGTVFVPPKHFGMT